MIQLIDSIGSASATVLGFTIYLIVSGGIAFIAVFVLSWIAQYWRPALLISVVGFFAIVIFSGVGSYIDQIFGRGVLFTIIGFICALVCTFVLAILVAWQRLCEDIANPNHRPPIIVTRGYLIRKRLCEFMHPRARGSLASASEANQA